MKEVYTAAELEAYWLLVKAGRCGTSNDENMRDAADYVLGLAQRIRDSRAAATMSATANAEKEGAG